MKKIEKFKGWIFSRVHQNKLIYNCCWEDPRCDRMLMDIQKDSHIVMITSAGCNALDYLLDQPEKVSCIDMNYRQNALMELKKAGLTHLNHEEFFSLFGNGFATNSEHLYKTLLRDHISKEAKKYWDKHITYFSPSKFRNSFYYRGTSGLLAFSLTRFLKLKNQLRNNLNELFSSRNLEEQAAHFMRSEELIFSNKIVKYLFNNHYSLTLAGVPRSQQELMKTAYEGGTLGYVKSSFRKIFTTLDISENYFYKVYMDGSYTTDCCPEYLKENNFNELKESNKKISTYTTTISSFLKSNPDEYSHYVLLDHQDWLAQNDVEALREEWELILKNSKKGTKILLRSAAKEIDFFPDFVLANVEFDYQKAAEAHDLDRVGTYASVYIGTVK